MGDAVKCPGDCEGTGLVYLNTTPFTCADCDGTGERNPIFLVSSASERDAWLSRRTGVFRCPDCNTRFVLADVARVDAPEFPGLMCDPAKGGCGTVLTLATPAPGATEARGDG